MQDNAYDFSMFEAGAAEQRREHSPQFVAVKGGRAQASKVRKQVKNAWIVLFATVLLSLTILLVQSKVTLTELNAEIRSVNSDITDAKSQYNYLSSEWGKRTGMARIEDIAKQQGLMKINDSQVTYVRLDEESVIIGSETQAERIAESVQSGLLNAMDTLAP